MTADSEWGVGRYLVAGAGLASAFVLAASLKGGEPLDLALAGMVAAAGGIVGYVLHATRRWKERGPVQRLLRWVFAGAIAGLAVSMTGVMENERTPLALALGAAIGAFLTMGTAMPFLSKDYNDSNSDARTASVRLAEWSIWLAVTLITFGLIMRAAA